MSIERELLVRIYRFLKSNVENDFGLGSDIRELLTHPEPIKEREVSGKIISTDDACNWNLTVGALKDYDHVYVNGVRYTEFQPQPKPLTPQQISEGNQSMLNVTREAFKQGVKFAEKAHGIGGGEC
jgi:hypothetical protein